jgi:hypothetical protein
MKRVVRLSTLAKLVASYSLMVLLAWPLGGLVWSTKRGVVPSLLEGIGQRPQFDAAHLAFRFGTVDHARTLLSHLPPSSDPFFASVEAMKTELQLAALDGEHLGEAKAAPHLNAAAAACARFRSDCALEPLQELAKKLANQRAHPP